MADKKYKVIYKNYVVKSNTQIRKGDFSCITFENIGDVNAIINNCIPLPNGSSAQRGFNERVDVVITSDFNITFDSTSTGISAVLVIEAYYTEIR